MQTMQEFFNKTLRLMEAQGKPAMDGAGACAYRMTTPEGKVIGCAIGAHLPTDIPQSVAEVHGGILTLSEACRKAGLDLSKLIDFELTFGGTSAFLTAIQVAHDRAGRWTLGMQCGTVPPAGMESAAFLKNFKDSMREVAEKWQLVMPEDTTLSPPPDEIEY